MKQLDLFNAVETVGKEQRIIDYIKPKFDKIIDSWYLPTNALSYEVLDGSGKLSIKLFDSVICRYKLSGKNHYIEIPTDGEKYIPLGIKPTKTKSDNAFLRIPLTSDIEADKYTNTLCSILIDIIMSIPKEFSCCSRYKECSDVGKCIHPDRKFAMGCFYKRVLKSGRVFYGKNAKV